MKSKEVDEAYQELEKQHAKLYLEMMHTEKRDTTEARLKWACEKYIYMHRLFFKTILYQNFNL